MINTTTARIRRMLRHKQQLHAFLKTQEELYAADLRKNGNPRCLTAQDIKREIQQTFKELLEDLEIPAASACWPPIAGPRNHPCPR